MHIEAPPRRRHNISLTPLIDVVFILLLFFMLATNFTDWRDITLATGAAASSEQRKSPAVVHVAADGTLRYDGATRSIAEIGRLLRRRQASGDITAVIVQPTATTALGPTVAALDAFAATGLPVALGRTPGVADTLATAGAPP